MGKMKEQEYNMDTATKLLLDEHLDYNSPVPTDMGGLVLAMVRADVPLECLKKVISELRYVAVYKAIEELEEELQIRIDISKIVFE